MSPTPKRWQDGIDERMFKAVRRMQTDHVSYMVDVCKVVVTHQTYAALHLDAKSDLAVQFKSNGFIPMFWNIGDSILEVDAVVDWSVKDGFPALPNNCAVFLDSLDNFIFFLDLGETTEDLEVVFNLEALYSRLSEPSIDDTEEVLQSLTWSQSPRSNFWNL